MLDSLGEILGAALRSGMFLFGLSVGFGLGAGYAIMRRAFKDWRTVSKSVPGFRKTAFRTVPRVVKFGLIAGFVGIVAVAGYGASADELPTTPASVPSGVPSSPAPTRSR